MYWTRKQTYCTSVFTLFYNPQRDQHNLHSLQSSLPYYDLVNNPEDVWNLLTDIHQLMGCMPKLNATVPMNHVFFPLRKSWIKMCVGTTANIFAKSFPKGDSPPKWMLALYKTFSIHPAAVSWCPHCVMHKGPLKQSWFNICFLLRIGWIEYLLNARCALGTGLIKIQNNFVLHSY